ncbi:glycosyltransferase family 2 protein [Melioribacteraceae bacterium 4301-Me]|uniref:glycosyltransferase family 2 protein n=1 Tax=Pyranulibacter aquaticus TaxID=3163344 RepID=UPI00359B607E
MVSVIIIQHNNINLTRTAIESFLRFHTDNFEIILVDNNSTEQSPFELIKDFPNIKLITSQKNLGFGAANNLAAQRALGNILLFLNNDVIIKSEILKEIEKEFSLNQHIGIIGPKLLNEDNSLQLSCGKLPSLYREFLDKILYKLVDKKNKVALNYISKKHLLKKEKQWVTGAALFIKKELFLELNGFDESFFMYYEDKDLCARAIAKGKKIIYFPKVSLIHLRGKSLTSSNQRFLFQKYRESQILYYQKHRPKFEHALLRIYLKLTGKLN